jgi:hypothetical protein
MICLCRIVCLRSLDNSFDGVKNMKTSQNKKRTSSTACLAIVKKNKNNVSKKNMHLWFGFKAMNALNASQRLDEVAYKSVSELVKNGMNEKETLEYQNYVPSYPYVPQKKWLNMNDVGEQNYHHIQIPSDIDICDGFAMDYHIALFFQLEEMIISKEDVLDKITKRLEDWKIFMVMK